MDELQRLESTHLAGAALSLYLPLEGDAAEEGFVKRWLRHLERPGASGREAEADAALQRELDRVEERIREMGPRGPAVAAFSCEPSGLLEVFELPETVAPLLVYASRLETAPLRALLERRPPALVAVVDKENGWLFEVSLDTVSELKEIAGRPVHHHRQGQTLSTTLQRRADQQVERNLKPLALAVDARLRREPPVRRLIVAGPSEARSVLLAELSPASRAAVERETAVPAYLTPGEMRDRVRELATEQPARI
jgi:Bacterial archaeo-eukaryotic release factor family 10